MSNTKTIDIDNRRYKTRELMNLLLTDVIPARIAGDLERHASPKWIRPLKFEHLTHSSVGQIKKSISDADFYILAQILKNLGLKFGYQKSNLVATSAMDVPGNDLAVSDWQTKEWPIIKDNIIKILGSGEERQRFWDFPNKKIVTILRDVINTKTIVSRLKKIGVICGKDLLKWRGADLMFLTNIRPSELKAIAEIVLKENYYLADGLRQTEQLVAMINNQKCEPENSALLILSPELTPRFDPNTYMQAAIDQFNKQLLKDRAIITLVRAIKGFGRKTTIPRLNSLNFTRLIHLTEINGLDLMLKIDSNSLELSILAKLLLQADSSFADGWEKTSQLAIIPYCYVQTRFDNYRNKDFIDCKPSILGVFSGSSLLTVNKHYSSIGDIVRDTKKEFMRKANCGVKRLAKVIEIFKKHNVKFADGNDLTNFIPLPKPKPVKKTILDRRPNYLKVFYNHYFSIINNCYTSLGEMVRDSRQEFLDKTGFSVQKLNTTIAALERLGLSFADENKIEELSADQIVVIKENLVEMEVNTMDVSWIDFPLRRRDELTLKQLLLFIDEDKINKWQVLINQAIDPESDLNQDILLGRLTRLTVRQFEKIGLPIEAQSIIARAMKACDRKFILSERNPEGNLDKLIIDNDGWNETKWIMTQKRLLEDYQKSRLINTNEIENLKLTFGNYADASYCDVIHRAGISSITSLRKKLHAGELKNLLINAIDSLSRSETIPKLPLPIDSGTLADDIIKDVRLKLASYVEPVKTDQTKPPLEKTDKKTVPTKTDQNKEFFNGLPTEILRKLFEHDLKKMSAIQTMSDNELKEKGFSELDIEKIRNSINKTVGPILEIKSGWPPSYVLENPTGPINPPEVIKPKDQPPKSIIADLPNKMIGPKNIKPKGEEKMAKDPRDISVSSFLYAELAQRCVNAGINTAGNFTKYSVEEIKKLAKLTDINISRIAKKMLDLNLTFANDDDPKRWIIADKADKSVKTDQSINPAKKQEKTSESSIIIPAPVVSGPLNNDNDQTANIVKSLLQTLGGDIETLDISLKTENFNIAFNITKRLPVEVGT